MPFGNFLPGPRLANKQTKRGKKKRWKNPEDLGRARREKQYEVLERARSQGADSFKLRSMQLGFDKLNAFWDKKNEERLVRKG
jgi:hypothetical protein